MSGFSIDADVKGRRAFNNTSVHWSFGKLSNLALDKRWGHLVTSFNPETEKIETTKVLSVEGARHHEVYEVLLKTGDKVVCSEDQKFWTRSGFKPLREITVGESLGCLKVTKIWWGQVVSIRQVASSQLFTLKLSTPNNGFITNNFIVAQAELE